MGGSRDKPFTLRVESDLYLPQGTGSAVCCAEGLLDSAHYRREIHRSGPPMRKRDVKRFPVKNRVLPTESSASSPRYPPVLHRGIPLATSGPAVWLWRAAGLPCVEGLPDLLERIESRNAIV